MTIDQVLQQARHLAEQGQWSQAKALLQQIVAVQPYHPQAHQYLGVIESACNNYQSALKHLQMCVKSKPTNSLYHYNLGTLYQKLGHLEAARGALKKAITLDNHYIEAYYNLGLIEQQLEYYQEALDTYQQCVSLAPQFAKAISQLAATLTALKKPQQAINYHRQAIELDAKDGEIQLDYAITLSALNELEKAITYYEKALALGAPMRECYHHLTRMQLMSKHYSKAKDSCEQWLTKQPNSQDALANRAFALMGLEQDETINQLISFDHYLKPYPFYPSAALAQDEDLDAYNQALAQYLRQHPNRMDTNQRRATRHGQRIEQLFSHEDKILQPLIQHIEQSISDYLAHITPAKDQPFTHHKPQKYRINAWSVLMENQGHQIPHNHPDGYISGVYYVQLPDVISTDQGDNAGFIEFGRAPEEFELKQKPDSIKIYTPQEGLMLLFPSYYYHRTIPFISDQLRISIAFDVIPA